ncbi:halocyanin [Natronomonas pharaonis DSM 2160]|uniref:Halocyanin n=1 Tax=Natronomonas pharaonis (strain ATCC 35678 / DSM 2160 / CIP 103997 / JCM 8858 / NBRC 14720 / NCIMB 2260 / Gabara) TaxID=348780 RepID=A0A1U7EV56_NATPD|nr:plastocyanin/azurin family copper-binding protein [Natronomonas pharaonis]CAI48891.1 halocyanin [Natronomonas pharaonis DSM 2160]
MHTTPTRRTVVRTAAAAAGLAVAGCLDSEPDEAPEEAPEKAPDDRPTNAGELGTPTDEMTVLIHSQPWPEFEPQIIHVTPGTTVEWLVETGRHDVTAYHGDNHPPHRVPEETEPWASDHLPGPGATYERTFDTEGVYDYVDTQEVCISHEIAGNVGRVVVGWPDPDAEPALEPLSEAARADLPSQVVNALEMFNEETRPVLAAGPDGA